MGLGLRESGISLDLQEVWFQSRVFGSLELVLVFGILMALGFKGSISLGLLGVWYLTLQGLAIEDFAFET